MRFSSLERNYWDESHFDLLNFNSTYFQTKFSNCGTFFSMSYFFLFFFDVIHIFQYRTSVWLSCVSSCISFVYCDGIEHTQCGRMANHWHFMTSTSCVNKTKSSSYDTCAYACTLHTCMHVYVCVCVLLLHLCFYDFSMNINAHSQCAYQSICIVFHWKWQERELLWTQYFKYHFQLDDHRCTKEIKLKFLESFNIKFNLSL